MDRRAFILGMSAAGVASEGVMKLAPSAYAQNLLGKSAGLRIQGRTAFLDGKAYRGIGCNFYDALDHKDMAAQFAKLKSYGVPFIRFDFGAFGPGNSPSTGWRKYLSDKKGWFGLRDGCVAAAEAAGLGLIPSMFWRLRTLPELMAFAYGSQEPVSAWGRASSNTRQFMRSATQEIVERYKNSSAIWGWEMGDEYDNIIAIDCNRKPNPALEPNRVLDTISFFDLVQLYNDWSSVVKSSDDSNRLVSTGSNLAIDDTYACISKSRIQADTYDQWMRVPFGGGTVSAPELLNPSPGFNSVSVHIYQNTNVPNRWFKDKRVGPSEMLKLHKKIADLSNRIVFVGEFGSLAGESGQNGSSGTDGTADGEKKYFHKMLDSVIAAKIQLSAVWNYGYLPNNNVKKWNINEGSERAYMLEAIAEANAKISP